MDSIIPVLYRIHRGPQANVIAQPLFFDGPTARATTLERASHTLQNELLNHFRTLSQQLDQRELLPWLNPPDFHNHRLALRLEDGLRTELMDVLLISYRALDRIVVFSPNYCSLHFEIAHLDELADRATAVFNRQLKQARKKQTGLQIEDLAIPAHCQLRLSAISLHWNPVQDLQPKSDRDMAGLGGDDEQIDGAAELQSVGRLLNRLYPENLDRALGCDAAVAALDDGLRQRKRQAVLLLGESGVGKTALVHEWLYVQRRLADAAPGAAPGAALLATVAPFEYAPTARKFGGAKQLVPGVWLIAPQRLISGMSYVGQWEARVLAILKHAQNRDLLLYFDDLLGLLSAGISSGSQLAVVDLLMPAIAKQQVRVLAEITPGAWRVLREKRREFADLFQVVPVHAPTGPARWQILAGLSRSLEAQFEVQFDVAAMPFLRQLCARYAGDRAFPGQVADTLKRLAARAHMAHRAPAVDAASESSRAKSIGRIGRNEILADFSRRLGLRTAFLDNSLAVSRADIRRRLQTLLTGQAPALEAITDRLMCAQTGMNDPKRPLAVMLLLGPTGVGKTQAAKALARYLSDSDDALLRFDLNEYTESADAARLVGTFAQADGLLTAAITRQPCAVVLFDEVEKAAPEVFDVLLSVLDEGRLTDAHGRVADFRQAFIVLTSNLGATQAQTELGFTPAHGAQSNQSRLQREVAAQSVQSIFLQAAKNHFRPEFFNRLDHVIGFSRFDDQQLRDITENLVRLALQRTGISARLCIVELQPHALDMLGQLGRNEKLGARALKRAIERLLMAPLARHLAVLELHVPTHIRFDWVNGEFALTVTPYVMASALMRQRLPEAGDAHFVDWLDLVEQFLAQIDDQLSERRAGDMVLGAVDDASLHYYACRQQSLWIEEVVQGLRRHTGRRPNSTALRLPQITPSPGREGLSASMARANVGLTAHLDSWRDGLEPNLAPAENAQVWQPAQDLLAACAWLQQLTAAASVQETVTLQLRLIPADAKDLAAMNYLQRLGRALEILPGCMSVQVDQAGTSLQLQGFGVCRLLAAEVGFGLHRQNTGLGVQQVLMQRSDRANQVLNKHGDSGQIAPDPVRMILRVLDPNGQWLDLRTGLQIAETRTQTLAKKPATARPGPAPTRADEKAWLRVLLAPLPVPAIFDVIADWSRTDAAMP